MPTDNRSSNTEQMVSVPVSKLKKIHRDLDACQKVIWLRGGFDPAYCNDAQNSLKDIDALLTQPPDLVAPFPGYPPVPEDRKLSAAQSHEEPVAWLDIVSGNTFDNAEVIETAGRKAFPLYGRPPASDGFSAEQMTVQGADGYRNGIKAAAELAEDYPELAQAIRALPLPQ